MKGTDKSHTLKKKDNNRDNSNFDSDFSKAFKNEVKILSDLSRHPHVIKMVGSSMLD